MEDRGALPMSRASQYAIRMLAHLARLPREGTGSSTITAIAEAEGIPGAFLAKIVRTLVRAGLLEACRGPGGGVSLARPAEEISVLEVIEAAGEGRFLQACLLGFGQCSDENPCALHGTWAETRVRLRGELERATIAEIAAV
jgi:Rrf2 family transcriptional regulator, iron-sulfur cluster assembly transcription factor